MHYVPVKNDLSDLLIIIEWLIDNDEEAFNIAQNGNDLYEQLYQEQTMNDETVSIFSRYASLMKYVPERPHKKFRIRIDHHDDTTREE